MPPRTLYHRTVGWHAVAMRRAVIVGSLGLLAALVVLLLAPWQLAITVGWDVSALAFLASVWPIVLRADGQRTEILATREDDTRQQASALVIGASTVSLLGVGIALKLAGQQDAGLRLALVCLAVFTVVTSWTVVNTVFTLRYAHLHYTDGSAGIGFGDSSGRQQAEYRDFAYVAFTIGMTYQVSDTTVRDRRLRRTVLVHALISYLFGVVIIAGAINLIAGLLR
jgi:uncharacterized membrane protein